MDWIENVRYEIWYSRPEEMPTWDDMVKVLERNPEKAIKLLGVYLENSKNVKFIFRYSTRNMCKGFKTP